MRGLSSEVLARASGGRHVGPVTNATSLVADSRVVCNGVAFAAVRGGHAYVGEALANGAPFVVVEKAEAVPAEAVSKGATAIVTDDVVVALGRMAAVVRAGRGYRVVGITGSTGKTLTKDFAAAALGVRYRVHAAPSSYNNEIGVPLVVLGCPDDAELVVCEVAARHIGEIAELCAIVRPSIGVITGIGITHLEEFGTREAIARTKGELFASLPADGLAIVPSNDEYRELLASLTSAHIVTVGEGGDVSWRASEIDAEGRTHGSVTMDGADVAVTLPIAGRPLVKNAAMALCVARECGVDIERAAEAISVATPTSYRMQILRIGGWTVVNDAYNANPASVASALESVREMANGAPIWAVLAEMAELGPASEDAHLQAGLLAKELGYDGVIVVGGGAAGIALGAGDIAHRVGSMQEAAVAVRENVLSGGFVLVKGSRVAGLEKLPDLLGA